MITAIWGPLCWRCLHGMAYQLDHRDNAVSARDVELFCLFLIILAWVLPCVYCRESYTRFISAYLAPDPVSGQRKIDRFMVDRQLQVLLWELHNLVNTKLQKPLFPLALMQKRAAVWDTFKAIDFFALLFIITLNYTNNGEPDKETYYRRFFTLLPELLDAVDEPTMGAALESVQLHALRALTQTKVMRKMYTAFEMWWAIEQPHKPVPTLEEIVDTYSLCKSV